VFPYVDVLKPCSLEVIWSQSGLAISRKSCHPQLLLSWCRLASFSCVRARSNQSPTACLRLSSSTEKMLSSYYVHCGLVWLFCWARIQIDLCVFICLVLEVKQPAVRAYVSRSDCAAGGDHWIMLNIAEQLCRSSAWSVENYQECNTTFPKKSWCVYRSSSDVSGSLRLVVSGFDLLVGRNPAIAHCKFNSSWLPWKVTWWVRNPGKGETSRKLILSCRFHEAEGDTRAWFI
jgi:hypothetical protein